MPIYKSNYRAITMKSIFALSPKPVKSTYFLNISKFFEVFKNSIKRNCVIFQQKNAQKISSANFLSIVAHVTCIGYYIFSFYCTPYYGLYLASLQYLIYYRWWHIGLFLLLFFLLHPEAQSYGYRIL